MLRRKVGPTPRTIVRASALALAGATLVAAVEAHADPSSTSIEKGYDLGEIQTPRALAMGGAVNAISASSTALFTNPANMPFARVYHLEALGSLIPEARRQSYGGAIVDSLLNRSRLAGGLGGTWNMQDPDGIHRTWYDVRAGLAYPLGDRFSIGITGRYLHLDQSVASGPLGASLASDGKPNDAIFDALTFDAGASLLLGDSVHIGAAGHNLTATKTGLAPLTVAGGIGFTASIVTLEADALVDFTTYDKVRARYMGGAEVFVADHVPIRAGYRFDQGTETHAVSFGLGYLDRRWGVELSGRRDVAGDHPSTAFTLSLRYFYDPSNGSGDFSGL